MAAPRALLFDAMGTLIGLRHSVGHTYAAAAAEHGLHVEAAAIDQHFPRLFRQAPPLAFPHLHEATALHDAEVQWWGARIEAVLQACGAGPAPIALQRQLFERYRDPALWRVYDDVSPWLETWHGRGLALAVVSNFDSRLPGLLEDLGLARWLQTVVVSSQAGAAKPSPKPFQLALEQLQLPPEQAWHVGDSPDDRLGAQAAGVRCVLVQRP